jgi:hypothetical protein
MKMSGESFDNDIMQSQPDKGASLQSHRRPPVQREPVRITHLNRGSMPDVGLGFSIKSIVKKAVSVVTTAAKVGASVVTKPIQLVSNVVAPHGAMAKGGSLSNKLVASRDDVIKTGRAAIKVGAAAGLAAGGYAAYGILASAPGVASGGGLLTYAGASAAGASLVGGGGAAVVAEAAAPSLYTSVITAGETALTGQAAQYVSDALNTPGMSPQPEPETVTPAPTASYIKYAAIGIPVMLAFLSK